MSKIPLLVVALVVGVIMVTTAVIPLVSDYSDAKTFSNEGQFDLTYTQSDDITLVWDHTAPGVLTVNDVAITMPTLTNGQQRTVMCGDNWIIRYGYGDTLGGNYVQWYPSIGASILASVANEYDLTVTCSEGTVSVTDTASTPNTATGSYTYVYCVSNDGAYVMKNADESVYMNGDSMIYAMGLTNVGTFTSTGIKATGTIDDGITWTTFRGDGFTFTDSEITYTEVSGYEDLYLLESMTATVSKEGQSTEAVYSYFIVPSEVTAERANPDQYKALVSVLPILAIVGLIAVAAGAMIIKGKS